MCRGGIRCPAPGTVDVTAVTARIIEILGVDDERVEKLGALTLLKKSVALS